MLHNQAPLIRSIGFPKAVLPISLVLSNAFYFLVALAVPFLLSLYYAPRWGCWPRWTWALVPAALMLQIIFVAGLALVVSILGVYFQDTANITGHVLHMWMFFSPVLYTMDQVPEHLRHYFQLNPMAFLLPIYRDLIILGRLPDWGLVLGFALTALAAGFIGYIIFLRHEGRLVQRL
jgi:ABC-type polysaccharide/polyol phosphate export permease